MNICPTCGNEYQRLGQHFALGSCDRPELSNYQQSLVQFVVLRGASAQSDESLSRLEVGGSSEDWIQAVSNALGWIANDPFVKQSATDVYDHCRELYPDANFNKDNFETIHAFTTIPHPTFDELNDPTDIDRPEPLTLRWVVQRRGTFVGTVFGSLHVDLRGWDVSGEQFRAMLDRHGIESVEYEGEGDSIDTFTERYHRSDDVVVVPHYDAVDLLDGLDLELSAIAETIERG